MKKIIPLDKKTRIVIETMNFILQYKRKSKKYLSYRPAGYFPDLASLAIEYINNSPERTSNAIKSIEDLIKVIQTAENNVIKAIAKMKGGEKI